MCLEIFILQMIGLLLMLSIRVRKSSNPVNQISGSLFTFAKQLCANSPTNFIRDGALCDAYFSFKRVHANLAFPSSYSEFRHPLTILKATRPESFFPSILKIRSSYANSFKSHNSFAFFFAVASLKASNSVSVDIQFPFPIEFSYVSLSRQITICYY
jgi:hypothetical protein